MSFLTDLYLSGTTFFTLGLGDVTPLSGVGRFLVVTEVAFGFIFLALVISYVPVIYQAFSRRELRISLLDARAGSPATAVELLRRNCACYCMIGKYGAPTFWRATSPIPSWPSIVRSMSHNPGWKP